MNKIKLYTMVDNILETFEGSRNSDITLMIAIWETYYKHLLRQDKNGNRAVYLDSLYELPREDNIKRIRAKIQNEENKWLPPDPAVRKKRKIAEEQWYKYLGYAVRNPDQTELPIEPRAVSWLHDD